MLTFHIVATAFVLEAVQTLRVMPEQIRRIERKIFKDAEVMEILNFANNPDNYKYARRSFNPDKLAKARELYRILKKTVNPDDGKAILRQAAQPEVTTVLPDMRKEHAAIVENELKISLDEKKSALFDRPYLENRGLNDFLVMRPDVVDPFVTVIPNAIYYHIEKKCVNWLDDCSLKGIRARLLRGVQSPYK